MTNEPATLRGVAAWIVSNPCDALLRRWNYKSAILSSVFRGQIFFAANLSAGPDAALAAFLTELCFRGVTAGFYGALTQAFRRVQPPRAGVLGAMVVLPVVAHSLEFLVHWLAETEALARSIALSLLFTAFSTSFNCFAMRHGALVVGDDSHSLVEDLRAVPRLIGAYLRAAFKLVWAVQ